MNSTKRRSFLATGAKIAAISATVGAGSAAAQTAPEKKAWGSDGKPLTTPQRFSPAISYGNLLFLSGIGAHFEGDIKAHTKHVLDEIQKQLEAVGSSMEQVLKVQVYLADLKDYDAMNEVYTGRWGAQPPVRTTVAVAGVPGKSLVEIDVVAYI